MTKLPYQVRLNTGATCLAFLSEHPDGYYLAKTPCGMSFDRTNQKYNVADIMDPIYDIEIRKESIVMRQEIHHDSPVAIVYACYLANWMIQQEADNLAVDQCAKDYVDALAEKFASQNGGVSIYTYSYLNYYEAIGDVAMYEKYKQLRDFEMGKRDSSPRNTSCEEKVVKVDFGSKNPK